MNIYDISEQACVSIATVSRVLNNSPHVSEKTRQHVLQVIREAGFVPNAFARGLGLNTMMTIGLLCPDASDPYLSSAISLLEHAFRENLYDCLLVCTGRERADLDDGIRALSSRHVDGMVLMGSSFVGRNTDDNRIILDTAGQTPLVILNGSLSAPNVYSVVCDDFQATRDAVARLAQEGRKRMLYLYHALNPSGEQKLQGFLEGLRDAGLQPDSRYQIMIEKENKQVHAVSEIVRSLWKQGLRFDSVLVSEDMLAVGALKALSSMGLSIPEDVSLIGYNNSILCQCTAPELTSIDNRLEAICDQIVQTMIGVLSDKEMPLQTVFRARIAERGSTRTAVLPPSVPDTLSGS